MSTHAIVVGGKAVELRAPWPVHLWTETKMHFTAAARTRPTRAVINHWTGAENPPDRLFENLKKGRLSVHFAIDVTGEIWQYMDAHAYGAHCAAQGMNAFSVGIENIGRGNNFGAPNRGILRQRAFETIHGTKVMYDDLTPAQLGAGVALNEALCLAYGLPMRVPEHPKGDVLSLVLSARDAAAFSGCAGHLHFEPKKIDPGLGLLRAIRDRGRALSPPEGVA